jgi:hypothetical protein
MTGFADSGCHVKNVTYVFLWNFFLKENVHA